MKLILRFSILVLFLVNSDISLAQNAAITIVPSPIKDNKFTNIYERYNDTNFDIYTTSNDSLAGSVKAFVYRYDSIGKKQFSLYTNTKYDYDAGYWVGISDDNGKTWHRYYTGLAEDYHYCYIKHKSFIPFIKNDSTLEIEIAQLKHTFPGALPGIAAKYELVTDNLIMQININELIKDSDNDGLTDIVEEKLLMNSFSKDSDNDGIQDAKDTNPRHASIQNKYTALYEYFLNLGDQTIGDSIVPFTAKFETPLCTDIEREIYYLVTDDTNLTHITGTINTYIILNTEEDKLLDIKYNSTPKGIHISSLEPIKNKPHYYKICVDKRMWGNTYIVIEKKDHWIVRWNGSWQI